MTVASATEPMRTEGECLAMAAAMERWAGSCGSPGHRAEFRSIAELWRGLASRAAWQDAED
jgi:hypothetical protein